MSETLRPSTLGEILDRTFQIYRNRFWRFVGIGALPLLVALLVGLVAGVILTISGIAGRIHSNPVTFIRIFTVVLVYVIVLPVYLGAYAISAAGITEGTVLAQRGEAFTIRGVLRNVWPRFWTYFWYLLLQGILAVLVPGCAAGALIAPLFYLIARSGTGFGSAFFFGLLAIALGTAAFGLIVWLFLGFAIGMAVCVVEKKTAWESLKRSWRLSNGTRGRIFVLYLLMSALALVVVMMSYFMAALLVALASLAGQRAAVMAVMGAIAAVVYLIGVFGTQIALLPMPWIALTLFYFDQRIRKEGYDIEWMMQQAGLTESAALTPPAAEPAGFRPVTPPDTLREP